jgi:hypothetical protein
MFFLKPHAQWERILSKPIEKQIKFLNKVCHVNKRDALVIREAFFDNLSFPLIKEIFLLVRRVVDAGGIDPEFEKIICDRLLRITEVEELYPEEYEDDDDNVIFGEGYHVYTASYSDLDFVIDFIKKNESIKSICDLGSGSGRAIFYLSLMLNSNYRFKGIELVEQRVDFTNKLVNYFDLTNVEFEAADFLKRPETFDGYDAYYLYDPVGTNQVPILISLFEEKIKRGEKFYILFISGWDDVMLNALNGLDSLELKQSLESTKQDERFVNFYQVI